MNSLQNINIKLIQGLNLLSGTEFNKFIIFSSSKYFAGDRDYSKLLEILKIVHSSGFEKFNNKTMIEYLEEKSGMNKITILNRMSELFKIYEKFIINEVLNNDKFKKTTLLLEYYLSKKSSKLFDYVLNSYRSETDKESFDTENIENEYKLTELSAIKNFRSTKFKLFIEQFSRKSEYQIFSFTIKLLKESFELKQQKINGTKVDSELSDLVLANIPMKEILVRLKNSNNNYYLLACFIYEMYLAFNDFSDTKHFKSAKEAHSKIKSELSKYENHFVYTLLILYCINQTNLDRREFYHDLFEIIDDKLREGYFDELKIPNIPVNNFRDYVLTGLRVKKIDWVKKFILDYSPYLPVQYRQDDIFLAEGMIAIEEKKYEEAIMILNKVKKKNYIHYLDSTFNKLRAFYELRYYYDAFKEIEKIKEYLTGNKYIPNLYMKNFSAVLHEINMLIKYSEKKTGYDNLHIYCKKNNYKLKSSWVTEEVKRIFKVKS